MCPHPLHYTYWCEILATIHISIRAVIRGTITVLNIINIAVCVVNFGVPIINLVTVVWWFSLWAGFLLAVPVLLCDLMFRFVIPVMISSMRRTLVNICTGLCATMRLYMGILASKPTSCNCARCAI